jgi:hypothetical protein
LPSWIGVEVSLHCKIGSAAKPPSGDVTGQSGVVIPLVGARSATPLAGMLGLWGVDL